jgi:hypothetical protein
MSDNWWRPGLNNGKWTWIVLKFHLQLQLHQTMIQTTRSSSTAAALLLALALTSSSSFAALVIDDFTTPQVASVSGRRPHAFSSVNAPEALGGNRELRVTRTSRNRGTAQLDVGRSFSPGAAFSLGFGTAGIASIVWDGLDRSRALNPRGLCGLDLTEGGVNDRFSLMAMADLGTEVTVRVYSGRHDWSEATLQIPAGLRAFQSFELPFDEFMAQCGSDGADFMRIGAVSLTFDGREGLDAGIRYFAVVPEPGTGLVALGLIGAVSIIAVRRKASPQG